MYVRNTLLAKSLQNMRRLMIRQASKFFQVKRGKFSATKKGQILIQSSVKILQKASSSPSESFIIIIVIGIIILIIYVVTISANPGGGWDFESVYFDPVVHHITSQPSSTSHYKTSQWYSGPYIDHHSPFPVSILTYCPPITGHLDDHNTDMSII